MKTNVMPTVLLLTLVVAMAGCDSKANKLAEQHRANDVAKQKSEEAKRRLVENSDNPLSDIWTDKEQP